MSDVILLADHDGGKVAKTAAELATFAKRGGTPVAVILCGTGTADALGAQLASTDVEKVIAVESDDFAQFGIPAMVDALAQILDSHKPAAVLIASSARGKEIAGRLAVRTSSGIITDAVDVAPDFSTTQSIFGGSFTVSSKVTKGVPVVTVRPSAIEGASSSNAPIVEKVNVAISDKAKLVKISSVQPAVKGGRPELTEAKIVISGGRGTNGDFTQVEAMADLLGAAVGASRAATDAGWYPHTHQVGQTGKTVSPQLYVACGISGAIQHRAGMQTSKTIVAINKDPEAPIFDLADFGVVGDLFAVLPQAREAIQAKRS
ncbi:MAG: electron transfer flavoprotein subunit alpha/FixB family protein [Actinomycetota bacterium]